MRRELEAGRIVLLLVDEKLFHGETCPHWIVVHGIVDELFLIHDPWTEVMAGETWLDGYDLAPLGRRPGAGCALRRPVLWRHAGAGCRVAAAVVRPSGVRARCQS